MVRDTNKTLHSAGESDDGLKILKRESKRRAVRLTRQRRDSVLTAVRKHIFVAGAESRSSNVCGVVTDVLYVYHRQPADVMNVARYHLCVTHSVIITPDFIVQESKSSVTLTL